MCVYMLAVRAGRGGRETVGGMRCLVRRGFGRHLLPNQIAVLAIETEESKLQLCQCSAASAARPTTLTRSWSSLRSTASLSLRCACSTAGLRSILTVGCRCRNDKNLVVPNHGRTGTLTGNLNLPFDVLCAAPLDRRTTADRHAVAGWPAPMTPVAGTGM